jgi:hypothetical protein
MLPIGLILADLDDVFLSHIAIMLFGHQRLTRTKCFGIQGAINPAASLIHLFETV